MSHVMTDVLHLDQHRPIQSITVEEARAIYNRPFNDLLFRAQLVHRHCHGGGQVLSPRFVVAGTDTGIGKTIFSAALTGALNGSYWKPVQSGVDGETDSETVVRLSGVPHDRILPEAYRLSTPASPHLSARLDGVTIDPDTLMPQRSIGRW